MSLQCNKTEGKPTLMERTTNQVILPVQMILGLFLQTTNYLVLRRRRMKHLRYGVYLKALSFTYLTNIIFLIPAIIRKNQAVDQSSYPLVYYHAKMEQYFINLFLFCGNLIIVALSIEPLRALLQPFKTLNSSNSTRHLVLVISFYALVGIVILPLTAMRDVSVDYLGNNGTMRYCLTYVHIQWLNYVRYLVAALFEVILLLLISFIYTWLFIKYREVRKGIHLEKISAVIVCNQKDSSPTNNLRRVAQRHQRATALCLGSITAFLVCNLPSAILELLYLISLVEDGMNQFFASSVRFILRDIANCMLTLNFTLTILLQCWFSQPYREEFRELFQRRHGRSGSQLYNVMRSHSGPHGRSPNHPRTHLGLTTPPNARRATVISNMSTNL